MRWLSDIRYQEAKSISPPFLLLVLLLAKGEHADSGMGCGGWIWVSGLVNQISDIGHQISGSEEHLVRASSQA